MKRKLGFIFAIAAFFTPILIGGITAVTERITQSDTEYVANFLGGAILGGVFELVFAIVSLILLIKNHKDHASETIIIFDIIMILSGLFCSLGLVLSIIKLHVL